MRSIIFYTVLFVFLAPLGTLIHELGHAAAGLLLTRGGVLVQLGSRRSSPTFTVGRLSLVLRPLTGFNGVCHIEDGQTASANRLVWFQLAGPLTSLVALGVLVAINLLAAPASPLWQTYGRAMMLLFGIQAVLTFVPVRYPRWFPGYGGRPSDGWVAMRLWSLRNADSATT